MKGTLTFWKPLRNEKEIEYAFIISGNKQIINRELIKRFESERIGNSIRESIP